MLILEAKFPHAADTDRRVYVWGLSETGALGLHKSLRKQSKKQAAFIQHPTRLQFAETSNILDIACGYGFSAFAVKREDGTSLYGSGINTDTQLGYHKHPGVTNKPIELVVYPVPINLPKSNSSENIQIKSCAAGRAHLLAQSDTGVVYTLGNNAYGQCGRPIVPNEDYRASEIINTIETVGDNERIENIHCGQDHSLFVTHSGKVFSCGWGADGQTGLGHYDSCDRPSLVSGDISGEKIVKVTGSVDCVLALNGKLF